MKLNRKNKYLVLGIVMMTLICYLLAIKKTTELRKEYHLALKTEKSSKNIEAKLSQLSKKEEILNLQLTEMNLGNTSIQNNLLKVLNMHCMANQVKIIAFNAPHKVQTINTSTKTHIFTLEGSYNNILKILNVLENQGSFGRITHLNFEKKHDFRSRRKYLQTKVYLEDIK